MFFNSYEFILLFLPVSLAGYYILGRFKPILALGWLIAASLVFYAFQQKEYVGLLCFSTVLNYAFGLLILKTSQRPRLQKTALALGIFSDLGLLFYFKYYAYFSGLLMSMGQHLPEAGVAVVLPLGISFYTFTQIAYLVDCRRGIVKDKSPNHYGVFVTFFPHLMAGPILHHSEIMPQFTHSKTYRLVPMNLVVGLMIFIFGLAKKVLLADTISPWVIDGFEAPENVSFYASWATALSYAMQIYFDFSGYSDMAIGLARMFGVQFPLNFDSPYKSKSIIEFWKRWHMTLTRFLRDYLYIPLGGNRVPKWRRYTNVMITMLLGGLWHGANWTFVVWGGLHGIYILINHGWRALANHFPPWPPNTPRAVKKIPSVFAQVLTFFATTVAWVFFRADDMHKATVLLAGMMGAHGGMRDMSLFSQREFDAWKQPIMLAVMAAISLLAPNVQQIMAGFSPGLGRTAPCRLNFKWSPNAAWALVTGAMFAMALLAMSGTTEFIYFKF